MNQVGPFTSQEVAIETAPVMYKQRHLLLFRVLFDQFRDFGNGVRERGAPGIGNVMLATKIRQVNHYAPVLLRQCWNLVVPQLGRVGESVDEEDFILWLLGF